MNDRQIVTTREQAHAAAMQAYTHARSLIEDGKKAWIGSGEENTPLSIRQRNFYHGVVLPQISEQVRVAGERYTPDIWKEHLRKVFLPDHFEMRKIPVWDKAQCRLVPGKRAVPFRVRSSTEDLSAKQYSQYLDKVIAHAVTEWGVAFEFRQQERDAVRYVLPARTPKVRTIDAETGEILECS